MRAGSATELFASLARVTGGDLPTLFAAIYLVTLADAVCGGSVARARPRRLLVDGRGVAAPADVPPSDHEDRRELARGLHASAHARLCAWASRLSAAVVRQRFVLAAIATLAAGVVHPTTALWFGGRDWRVAVGHVDHRPAWTHRRLPPSARWRSAAVAARADRWQFDPDGSGVARTCWARRTICFPPTGRSTPGSPTSRIRSCSC